MNSINHRFVANLSLFLPSEIKDIPFYNHVIVSTSDTIGSSFADEIAKDLFSHFEKLSPYLKVESFLSFINTFSICDREKERKNIDESGLQAVKITVVHMILSLVRKKLTN